MKALIHDNTLTTDITIKVRGSYDSFILAAENKPEDNIETISLLI